MKRIFIYSFLLAFISCNQTFTELKSSGLAQQQSKSTSTVSGFSSGSESKMTYELSQNTGDGTSNFIGNSSIRTIPEPEINLELHFEKSGDKVRDTLDTQVFSRLMDLNNVKKIQIDSLTYKVIDKQIKLKFIIALTRDEKEKLKIIDKYSMVYSSGFTESEPVMVIDKIEKSSIETFGNSY